MLAADLKAGKVKDAGASPAYALITLSSGEHYYINIRAQQQFASKLLTDALVAAPYHLVNVSEELEPPVRPEARLLKQLRAAALPLLLQLPIIIILIFMMGDVLRRAKVVGFEEKPTTSFDDVIGVEEAKEALQDIVAYLKQPDRFTRLGSTLAARCHSRRRSGHRQDHARSRTRRRERCELHLHDRKRLHRQVRRRGRGPRQAACSSSLASTRPASSSSTRWTASAAARPPQPAGSPSPRTIASSIRCSRSSMASMAVKASSWSARPIIRTIWIPRYAAKAASIAIAS